MRSEWRFFNSCSGRGQGLIFTVEWKVNCSKKLHDFSNKEGEMGWPCSMHRFNKKLVQY
jgi:hypothetical protein